MRTRYWGLYDYEEKEWLLETGWLSIGADAGKRERFDTWEDAHKAGEIYVADIHPRPFYVTTKPRKLPPEVAALIEAVKKFDQSRTGWIEVAKALDAINDESNQ